MDLEQVKKYLKDGYEQNGFDIISEPPDGETLLRYPDADINDITLRISHDDIQDYSELLAARHEFQTIGKTGMLNSNFRESLLIPLDSGIDSRDVDDLFFKRAGDSQTYAEVDTISLVFANFFRFEPGYINLCLDRLQRFPADRRLASTQRPIDSRHSFAQPLSIRVFDIGAQSIEEARRISDEIIEGALFTLAYDLGIPLMLADHYPKSRMEHARQLRANRHKVHDIALADGNFRHDWVRYYQAGIASPIASHQFLSFYQILELFFQDVTHSGVHDALYHLLRDEQFTPDNSNIAKIVTLVEAGKRDTTASELLAYLLRQHVDSQAIKQFILEHGGQAEETIHSLAQRIVTTHQAIVNSGARALPPSDASIQRDVPLVKFLAEQVILSTRD